MKTIFTTLSLLLVLATSGLAQSFREQFTEANLLSEDRYFGLSIPLWQDLLKKQPDNANLNYKLGRNYLDLGMDRERALPYLRKAAKDVKPIYDPFSADIKTAPIETYLYLGKAELIASNLDSAERSYQLFLEKAGKKHYLRAEAEAGLKMCATARKLMATPVKAEIVNIGSPINSPYAEYTPIVAFDENTLYFTSRRMRTDESNKGKVEVSTGLYYEDIYVSYRSISGVWLEPELLNINVVGTHSSIVSMSPDGRKIYIYKTFNGDGNIYESNFVLGTGWATPTLVGSDVNSNSNEFFATITADDQRLYFVSDRKGGIGGKDIWYCQKLPNGEWGKAINAGEPINTAGDEDAPYLHPDGKTMYFSSNGHESMGGYDVFFAKKDAEGKWTMPKNLGYPINSTDDDHSYVATPSGKRAYYSSNKGEGGLGSTDIYVIEYKSEEEAAEVELGTFAVLKGWVFPAPKEKLPDNIDITITDLTTNAIIGVAKPVERNGSFVFIIASGNKYRVSLTAGETEMYTEDIDIPIGKQYLELQREIFLTPSSEGQRAIALSDNVLGDVGRWKLSTLGRAVAIPIGSRVIYLDDKGRALDTAFVSKDGYFEFKKLPPSQSYVLKPIVSGVDNASLVITLEDKHKALKPITMVAAGNAFYEEGKIPESVLKQVESIYYIRTESGQPLAAGSVIRFINSRGETVFTEIIKDDGSFVYHMLDGDRDFELKLETGDELTEKVWIEETRVNKRVRVINLFKDGENSHSSIPHNAVKAESTSYYIRTSTEAELPAGAVVRFLDKSGNVLYTEVVKADRSFTFHTLKSEDFTIELMAEIDPATMVWIEAVKDGKVARTINLSPNGKGVFTSQNTSTGGVGAPAKTETPQPTDKQETLFAPSSGNVFAFKMHYNVHNHFDQRAMDKAVEAVKVKVASGGAVRVRFEGSASKVPTGFEGGNEALAQARLDNGKAAFLKAVTTAGVEAKKISTVSENSKVSGPDYQPFNELGESAYIDFQYFKITVD